MTSRLKRKLGELGVDPSSSKANESFCLIGTPLPPLEKSKDTGEFVPLWKQEVRDEKGRRRLHGAFTGGFSAGYFNTVGSKEGWAPSTFVSSRSDRAKQKAARPEDFMDEEDLAEMKDSQKLVDTNEEMDLIGGAQAGSSTQGNPEQDSLVNALEAALLPTPKDSVGARILKKMGWRLGSGIGPKVTWEQRKRQDALSSSTVPDREDMQNVEHDEAARHMYPPRDAKVPIFSRKDNHHGLGYTPGMGLSESINGKSREEQLGPNLSAGFGLGALNDAEDDDVDVYDSSFNRGSSRLAYDGDADDNERIVMGSRNKPSSTMKQQPKPGFKPSMQTFHDGRPVLAGFTLSDRPVVEDKWFPLPDVPKGWAPNPRRVWEQDKENLNEAHAPPAAPDRASWKTGITADQRGSMLGETPLPAPPRSVFDYLAPKDRDRLMKMATGGGTTQASSPAPGKEQTSEPPPVPEPTVAPSLHISRVDPQIAKAALHGFQPFTADPVKQARYTAYLKSQVAMEGDIPVHPSPGQSIEEFNKEIADYAKAAQIFKPVSGTMANRFTSAAVVDVGMKPQEGLHTPTAQEYRESAEKVVKEERREESPKEHAARVGMFGPLTREIKVWQPAKLLCKRFGVKDPNPEPIVDEGGPSPATQSWQTPLALEGPDLEAALGTSKGRTSTGAQGGGRRDLANIGLGDDETQGADTLTYERPSKDIFKAIFASDDEGSDDEGAEDAPETKSASPGPPPATMPVLSSATTPTPAALQLTNHPHQSNGSAPNSSEPLDLSTFKPTFVPRAEREKHKPKSGGKEKGSKKDKKKKSGKAALVSFADEEGVEEERPKRRSRQNEKKDEDDDDSMWVEKPPPEVVQVLDTLVANVSTVAVHDEGDGKQAGPVRGRKRAVDFM